MESFKSDLAFKVNSLKAEIDHILITFSPEKLVRFEDNVKDVMNVTDLVSNLSV